MVNADATNKWYNESKMKLDHIISAIGISWGSKPLFLLFIYCPLAEANGNELWLMINNFIYPTFQKQKLFPKCLIQGILHFLWRVGMRKYGFTGIQ